MSTRRDFLSGVATACALAECAPFGSEPASVFTAPPADLSGQVRFPLASAGNLRTAGGAVTISAEGFSDKVLVMHLADDSDAAVTSTCSHAGCPVSFRADNQTVECPCHGSRFDLQGNVLRKPAPSPLREVLATHEPASDSIVLDYFSAVLPGVVAGALAVVPESAGALDKVGNQLT